MAPHEQRHGCVKSDGLHGATGTGGSTPTLPVWPEGAIGCKGDCGFEPAGHGLECRAGAACGRYLHPGDTGFLAVRRYYREAEAEAARGNCTADEATS